MTLISNTLKALMIVIITSVFAITSFQSIAFASKQPDMVQISDHLDALDEFDEIEEDNEDDDD